MTVRDVQQRQVGPKGQVVIAKSLRVKYGIKEGSIVEEIAEERGVLIVPINPQKLMSELEETARRISRKWPKGVSAVQAIKEDREK